MAVFTDSIIYNLALAFIIFAICFYLFFTSTFNYWKDRGIPYLQPVLFFGNLKDQFLGRKHFMFVHQEIYDQLQGYKYGGYFETKKPALVIRDPALVQQVLIKDFTHFYDRGFTADPEQDPLSATLFTLEGDNWRCLRNKLTPTFSTGKLKGMFEQICNCGEKVIEYIEEQSKIGISLDSKTLMSTFALDVIATCAFGLQMDKDNQMTKTFCDAMHKYVRPSKLQLFRQILYFILPTVIRKHLRIKTVPDETENVVMEIIRGTAKYRQENNINRNDFLQLLLDLQKKEQSGNTHIPPDENHDADDDVIDQLKHTYKDHDENPSLENQKVIFTEECIAAQSFIFLTAGFESVSSPISFTLFELTKNPQIQTKLHTEIDAALEKHNNQWTYQVLKEMTYLDQVLQETLRKYPVAVSILRICTQTYKIPDSNDIIEKGTRILIPIHAIHNDPQNHRSPEVFDPERFVNNNFRPSGTYLPFGDGPRICLGMRFAVLEMKVALSRVLSQYTVKLSSKTKLPLTYEINSLMPRPVGGLWFKFEKRTKF